MDSTSENTKQATQVSESRKEIIRENYKYVKLTGISNIINSLHSTDFSNEPLMHNRMNRIHVLKWKIKEINPSWHLADPITLMEYQILNLLDEIDHMKPWDEAENKLKYTTLFSTIANLKKLHPRWGILLESLETPDKNHLCKCHKCHESRMQKYRITIQNTPEKGRLEESS
jgi:hypothetical protein